MGNCNNLDERNWDLLLEAVDRKRVVPIIGDEFFYILEDGKETGIQEYLIRELGKKFGVDSPDADFSTISEHIMLENFRNYYIHHSNSQTDIYYEISRLLRNQDIHIHDSLKKLISIKKFPLILTTSFVPNLETLLAQEGIRCESIAYERSASSDIEPSMLTDGKTIIYHMFGVCSKTQGTYMVTEDDLLDYIHLWHGYDTRPKHLTRYIHDKFLMILGCNYPNWLFRFFWHSLRNFSLEPPQSENLKMMQGIISTDRYQEDGELKRFLSRIHTSVYECSKRFISDLSEKWSEFYENKNTNYVYDDSEEVEIFISYASEDIAAAKKIHELLTDLGAKAWYDKRELVGGDLYENKIDTAIMKAARFMPLISSTTITSTNPRFYRREWNTAHEAAKSRFNLPYFVPIRIDDCDPYDEKLPEKFRHTHMLSLDSDILENELRKLIREIRNNADTRK